VAIAGWIVDKSAVARVDRPGVRAELDSLAGSLFVCPVGELERRYSARSAKEHDRVADDLRAALPRAEAPADVLARALALQRDLATTACGIARRSRTS
jgi:hypothetical protein